MHYVQFFLLFCCTLSNVIYINATPLDISPKLDFDDDEPQHRPEKLTYNAARRQIETLTDEESDRMKTGREHFDVVCGTNGCNFTESSSSDGARKNIKDPLHTDIVVHIQTKVDGQHRPINEKSYQYSRQQDGSRKAADDIPDIPVFSSPDRDRQRSGATTKHPQHSYTSSTSRQRTTGSAASSSSHDSLQPNYVYKVYKLHPDAAQAYQQQQHSTGSSKYRSGSTATAYNNQTPTVSVHLIEGEFFRDDYSDGDVLLPYFPPTYSTGDMPPIVWYPPAVQIGAGTIRNDYRGDSYQRRQQQSSSSSRQPSTHLTSLQTSYNNPNQNSQRTQNSQYQQYGQTSNRYSHTNRGRYNTEPTLKIDDKLDKLE